MHDHSLAIRRMKKSEKCKHCMKVMHLQSFNGKVSICNTQNENGDDVKSSKE